MGQGTWASSSLGGGGHGHTAVGLGLHRGEKGEQGRGWRNFKRLLQAGGSQEPCGAGSHAEVILCAACLEEEDGGRRREDGLMPPSHLSPCRPVVEGAWDPRGAPLLGEAPPLPFPLRAWLAWSAAQLLLGLERWVYK